MEIKESGKAKERRGNREVPLEGNVCADEVLRVIGAEEFPIGTEISERTSSTMAEYLRQEKEGKCSDQSKMKEKDAKYNEGILSEENIDYKMSTEDEEEEEEVVPAKNRRKMRKRRVIYSVEGDELESAVEMADSTSQSESAAKRKISTPDSTPEKKKKKKCRSPSSEPERMATRSSDPNVGEVGMDVLSAASLGIKINEWADEIEEMRGKSKNLQGKVSGLMKIKINRIKEAVISLVMKAEAVGDPTFLRMRNKELDIKLKNMEKENIILKENIKKMKQVRIDT